MGGQACQAIENACFFCIFLRPRREGHLLPATFFRRIVPQAPHRALAGALPGQAQKRPADEPQRVVFGLVGSVGRVTSGNAFDGRCGIAWQVSACNAVHGPAGSATGELHEILDF